MAPIRDDSTLATNLDIVPTILKIAGQKVPTDLPGLDVLDEKAMAARKSIFLEVYTHDIADLSAPAKSLVTRVVINEWSKLLIPGTAKLLKYKATAPTTIELYDLKSDPQEQTNLATTRPEEVKRLQAIQDAV
ncbi:hypothetical protein BH11PLA2_BH11PLA2_45950 [soil metagenome]